MKKGYVVIVVLLFIVGIFLVGYPIFSNWYNDNFHGRAIDQYQEVVDNRTDEENELIRQRMTDYNKMLAMGLVQSEEAPPEIDFDGMDLLLDGMDKDYGAMLGVLSIPSINLECPIFSGVTTKQLQRGVGVLPGTSLPVGGEDTHSVITGHRGLPTAKLFTDLPKVSIGDVFYINMFDMKLAYEIREIQTIVPEDVESLKIQPGEDVVTLLTCVPYMINTHRLIASGYRIPYEEMEKEAPAVVIDELMEMTCCSKIILTIIICALLLFIMLLFIYLKLRQIWKIQKAVYDENHPVQKGRPRTKTNGKKNALPPETPIDRGDKPPQ